MGSPRLTRRNLLAAGAGAGALGVLRQAPPVLAAGGRAPARLSEVPLGLLGPGVRTVSLGRLADLLALEWQGSPRAHVELRFRAPGGAWSAWAYAGADAHEDGSGRVAHANLGAPIWAGGTPEVQLRSAHALAAARLHTIDVSDGKGAALAAAGVPSRARADALALAQPVLAAGPGQPPIIARSVWARGECPPSRAPAYGAVELAFVHHTQSPNGYSAGEVPAMLRSIYVFHRVVRGWHDIGYNFAIDRFGRAYEARAGGIDQAVVGAHAGGYNEYSTGVAVLGSYSSVPISQAAHAVLAQLLAWKLSLHGVPALGKVQVVVDPAGAAFSKYPAGSEVSLPRIAGHRDADATDCPGDALYGELHGIRTRASVLSGNPVQATIALQSAPAAPPAGTVPPAGGAPPAEEARLFGTLTLIDGTPLAGQTVSIQSRTVKRRGETVLELPLAEVQTDAEGQWTLPAGPMSARRQWLRALYTGAPGYGAAVSEAIAAPFTPPVPAP